MAKEKEPESKNAAQTLGSDAKKVKTGGKFIKIIVALAATILLLRGCKQDKGNPIKSFLSGQPSENSLCADAKNVFFAPGETEKKVPMKSSCWSGWIVIPSGTKWNYERREPGEMDMWFQEDLLPLTLPAGDVRYFPNKYAIFRVRGSGTFTVTLNR